MSLTDFMRNKKLNLKFKEIFKCPDFNQEVPILAKPKTNNYALIGTAFDYLLRFYISRNSNIENKGWVCEDIKYLVKFDADLKETTKKIINNAKNEYKKYLDTGLISNNIINSVINLAKLDGIIRSGGVLPNSIDINQDDLEDLKKLYSIIPCDFFMTNEKCILNPSFGTASLMVGGADADLIIGDTLIDIKTTINLKFTRSYFLQLIGYYILNDLGDINEVKKKVKINKLGIYYSRYGFLFIFNVSDIVSKKDFDKFKDMFIDVVQGFN